MFIIIDCHFNLFIKFDVYNKFSLGRSNASNQKKVYIIFYNVIKKVTSRHIK